MAVPVLKRRRRTLARRKWSPAKWSSSQLFHWFHGGVPAAGLASTIQGGVGNTTTGWHDASGNSRNVGDGTGGSINGTPDVVKPNLLEGINFARDFGTPANNEYLLQPHTPAAYTAPSDTAGCWWFIFKVLTGDLENADLMLGGWGASGSGTKFAAMRLFSSGGETAPGFYAQKNSGAQTSTYPSPVANTIIPNTNYSLAFEADQTGGTWRMWLNEVEITSLSNSGTAGTWLNAITTDSTLNRFTIGTLPSTSGVNNNAMNGVIYEHGLRRAVLGADETNFLAYLARQRAAA